ncbi:MAG TPA: RHS repeat-associated core domain-containing protein [Chitinophagales bacterium]|nr:RHS repeat-associated core domain-containing protein [Chitinophagales bacterium]
MLLPGREWQEGYRFAFNGKEQDPEQLGQGNIYDYGFRIYNSRLGKFLSVDPLSMSYPWYTPYQFAGNKPIWCIDVDGLEEFEKTNYYNQLNHLERTTLTYNLDKPDLPGSEIYYSEVYAQSDGNSILYDQGTTTLPALDFQDKSMGYPNFGGQDEDKKYSIRDGAKITAGILYTQWTKGQGPENSIIFGESPIVKSVREDFPYFKAAEAEFYRKWITEDCSIDGNESVTEYGVKFPYDKDNLSRIYFGKNLYTGGHFIGSFTLSASILDDGNTILFCLSDSKSKESANGHIIHNSKPRKDGESPKKSTQYYRFIWTEPINQTLLKQTSKNEEGCNQ